jgi:nucleoside-diphosphate kinase
VGKTFVLLKPDAVARGLVGRIVSRFEDAGLHLEAARALTPSRELITSHYPESSDWLMTVGGKTLESYAADGLDPAADLGTNDPEAIGRLVKGWLVDYISSGPVVAMIWRGNRVVSQVRKLVGHTLPSHAVPGTIRGDFSSDSAELANREGRPVRNLIHASGDPEEAAREIALWFGDGAS